MYIIIYCLFVALKFILITINNKELVFFVYQDSLERLSIKENSKRNCLL